MTGNETIPPKGGPGMDTPMRFPSSRTAAEKRAHLLWKPPHTPRGRVLLDRAERNAEAMSKVSAPLNTSANGAAVARSSQAPDATASDVGAKASDGRPAAD